MQIHKKYACIYTYRYAGREEILQTLKQCASSTECMQSAQGIVCILEVSCTHVPLNSCKSDCPSSVFCLHPLLHLNGVLHQLAGGHLPGRPGTGTSDLILRDRMGIELDAHTGVLHTQRSQNTSIQHTQHTYTHTNNIHICRYPLISTPQA